MQICMCMYAFMLAQLKMSRFRYMSMMSMCMQKPMLCKRKCACLCLCVCVNHLKRCKTSIFDFRIYLPVLFALFQFKQGRQAHHTYLTQRSYGMMAEG